MGYSPPGSSVCGIFSGKNIGVGCYFLLHSSKMVASKPYILHSINHFNPQLCISPNSFFLFCGYCTRIKEQGISKIIHTATNVPWKESYDKPRWHIIKQRHHLVDKGSYSQSFGFSSNHIWMWEVDYKKGWAPKNWCFQIVVLEKTLESALDSKEIKPVNSKGNQPWVFIERTDAKAETPIFWPPDAKNWPILKDPDAGKDLGLEEQGSRGWDSRTASPTQWTWICANSGRQSRVGKPGVLQSMG